MSTRPSPARDAACRGTSTALRSSRPNVLHTIEIIGLDKVLTFAD
jgi:hypothetical protein